MFTSVRGLLVGSFDCVFVVRGVLRRLHRLITGLVEPFQKFEIGEKERKDEEKKRTKRGRKGKRREKKRGVVKANSAKIHESHRKQTEVQSGLRFLPFEEGAGQKRKFLVRNLRSVA